MCDSMTKIYLACPYQHDEPHIVNRRARRATEIAARILRNVPNTIVFSPISHSHEMGKLMPDTRFDHRFWLAQDETFLEWADEVWVVDVAGWMDSVGVSWEIDYARNHNMPIRLASWNSDIHDGIKISPLNLDCAIPILGICGPAGSGKTSVAKHFVDRFHHQVRPVHVINFAAALKDAAETIGWDGEKDERGRKLLQILGTDIGRKLIDADIWVKTWMRLVYSAQYRSTCLIVADDVRFDNEAAAIREMGGRVIKLTGRAEDLGDNAGHVSEAGVSDKFVDVEINSSCELSDLLLRVEHYARECHWF